MGRPRKQVTTAVDAQTAFFLKLEAERYDTSWKDPQPMRESLVFLPGKPSKETKAQRDKRDKLMFNAGRYAAGARDKTAVEANARLEAELE